jgi:hypothetical protein
MIKRNRKTEYPHILTGRVGDIHISVVKGFMEKFGVSRAEALRMSIEASARYLTERENGNDR